LIEICSRYYFADKDIFFSRSGLGFFISNIGLFDGGMIFLHILHGKVLPCQADVFI
jgi:hypothetical protein